MKLKLNKREIRSLIVLACLVTTIITVAAKGNPKEIAGYVYDSGTSVWDLAERHCPDDMHIQDFVREIEKANGIEDAIVYVNCYYKIPVFRVEDDCLDMDTVVKYETSKDGLLLITENGRGYLVEE